MLKGAALLLRIYQDPVYTAAARIIGYAGCGPFHFFDEAKKLPIYDERRFREAMCDLTYHAAREAPPPTYQLNAEARKFCWQLLGPPQEHPLFAEFEEQRKQQRAEVGSAEEPKPDILPKPKKRARRKK